LYLLAQQNISATPKTAIQLTSVEQAELSVQVPDWEVIVSEGIETLRRVYKLKNFLTALEFANQISTIAEQGDHHPALLIEWGRVTVTWWSHSIGGLHLNDFVMAAKTDEIYITL